MLPFFKDFVSSVRDQIDDISFTSSGDQGNVMVFNAPTQVLNAAWPCDHCGAAVHYHAPPLQRANVTCWSCKQVGTFPSSKELYGSMEEKRRSPGIALEEEFEELQVSSTTSNSIGYNLEHKQNNDLVTSSDVPGDFVQLVTPPVSLNSLDASLALPSESDERREREAHRVIEKERDSTGQIAAEMARQTSAQLPADVGHRLSLPEQMDAHCIATVVSNREVRSAEELLVRSHASVNLTISLLNDWHLIEASIRANSAGDAASASASASDAAANGLLPFSISSIGSGDTTEESFGLEEEEDDDEETTMRRDQESMDALWRASLTDELDSFDTILPLLEAPGVDIDVLRHNAYAGVPMRLRAPVWQLLLGCLPAENKQNANWPLVVACARMTFKELADSPMNGVVASATETQINLDVPRTLPRGYRHMLVGERARRMVARACTVYARRHDYNYFQGLGDLYVPFLATFVEAACRNAVPPCTLDELSDEQALAVEADAYWCLERFLHKFNGLFSLGSSDFAELDTVFKRMEEILRIANTPLADHIAKTLQSGLYLFGFRWIFCCLTRELTMDSVLRVFDTYLAVSDEDALDFHLCVCVALLDMFSTTLFRMRTIDKMLVFLQHLPTQRWTRSHVQSLMDEAQRIALLTWTGESKERASSLLQLISGGLD